jgi:hypothetical protein
MGTGGTWSFSLDNANSQVQALNVGQSMVDTFSVTTVDGTSQTVAVTINGSNEDVTVPAPTLALHSDTGVSDYITSDNVVNVSLAPDVASWRYSPDGGTHWYAGSGTSFNLNPNAVYAAGTIQVEQTDTSSNVSSVGSNAQVWKIDSTAPNLLAPLNAKLVDGHTVEIYFNEKLTGVNSDAATIQSRIKVEVAGYSLGVDSLTIADFSSNGTNGSKVTFTTTQEITSGLLAKVSYVDPASDQTSGVLQDIAGNDVATNTSKLWTLQNNSAVTAVGDNAAVRVVTGGLLGSSSADTLTHTVAGEFLTGGGGNDTVNVAALGSSVSGSSSNWYVAAYNPSSPAELPAGVIADTGAGKVVYGFTNISNASDSVYVQAETINLGSTHFSVTNGVLQIVDPTGTSTVGQTIIIDNEVIQSGTSISIGSGKGADTITDSTDFTMAMGRTDTVVYTTENNGTTGLMNSKSDLLSGLEDMLSVSGANVLSVNVLGTTDTLTGMERLSFNTADLQQSDVVLIGTTGTKLATNGATLVAASSSDTAILDHLGRNGFGSLSDAASSTTKASALFVVDDTLSTMSRSSLISSLDGMFRTDASNHLSFSLTPTDSSSFVSFSGTSKVIFQAANAEKVTVLVVGQEGYASIDDAMNAAKPGDVIYITDNALSAPTTYTVLKEDMTFIANHSTNNDKLTLNLGDVTDYANPSNSHEIKNVYLLGDANINVNGNQWDNHIIGNRGNNIIHGSDGNDLIDSAGGNDLIYGDAGNDLLIASSAHAGFVDPTTSTNGVALLSGGAGNDKLIDTTTDGHKVTMTGGLGADVFKIGGLASDNGDVNVRATISDLSARSGDMLDFTQILTSSADASTALQTASSYSAGNLNISLAGLHTTAVDTNAVTGDAIHGFVNLSGSVQVAMTTATSFNSTPHLTGAAAASATDVHTDIFGSGSVSSEIAKLMPILEHNPLG